ncbi:T-cell surface glycoprotein CD3 zeta chain isoform X2 [Bombina bombina]|uniref:T-cell surface glycoprotein CD3 zeta chain isoform X2 n=1 Tax=Bombina bombina TaxID=8345 RepID=UPI00235AB90A|nr:T-cell surface glycoprotein CD3 zeta chain isoform X2 [Bombina bombina]
MKAKWVALSVFLQAKVLGTEAEQVFGLTNPKLCYVLDLVLFLYAIIITAFFFKEKCTKQQPQAQEYDPYSKLRPGQQLTYDEINKGRDPEKGGRRQKQRAQDTTVYTGLQRDKMADQYSAIKVKGEPQQRRKGKGNDTVYQGLSTATRDTYDALQMQPVPPPR